jgi:hypothetical protein
MVEEPLHVKQLSLNEVLNRVKDFNKITYFNSGPGWIIFFLPSGRPFLVLTVISCSSFSFSR